MLEYVLQVVILAIIFLCIFLEHLKHKELKLLLNQEGNLVKENLNYIASAIVGLSELLDEADQVINQVSQVPSMGEMMQQMLQGFIMQKLAPTIAPLQNVKDELITPNEITEGHGETWTQKNDDSQETEIQSD